MYENEQRVERMILAAVCCGDESDTRASLRELAALAETAGACVVGTAIQNRDYPDPGTYMGSGKIEEIREMVIMLDADGVICDDELSPAQMNNLENALDCRVADRTLLILDIFAGRAQTSEGKIQVELAQLKYRQAHLVGMRNYLSRLGGGIGTRGPGEKKLEIDRRLIADRIGALGRELKEVRKHREVLRAARKKGNIRSVAIVGYTNAGKSTLLNTMTDAGVLEEDALFATLDPTTRILDLPGGSQILMTDTVGFIDKLPHALIDAFRSTLEEAAYADYIIHVADASNPRVEQQMEVVYATLHELGADDKKIVTLFNKQDKTDGSVRLHDHRADYVLPVSAKEGTGLEDLRKVLEKIILEEQILVERVFPYTEAGKVALIRQNGTLLEEEYREDGIAVKAYVPQDIYGKI
uniref:GTPase HflX n=1 Tax=Eubacterium cellulosolvens TaxID=29322 RepID=UPI000484F12A|nr:GTPase HflX [[Eubacterium] cellulosolvens]